MTKGEDVEKVADPKKTGPAMMIMAHDDDEDRSGQEEYEQLLQMYEGSFRNIAEGEVITGTVLKVSSSDVVVDVGYKSEGIIAIQEFLDEQGKCIVQQGDTVAVLLERTEDRNGHIVLSREKAEKGREGV